MAKPRHLSKAPIIEAIIDIQIHPLDIAPDALISLTKDIQGKFTQVVERRRWSSEFTVKDGKPLPPVSQDLGLIGYQLATTDGREVVQFRLDGFTFSRLKPYEDWEVFRAEASRLWNVYAALKPALRIKRVATRFVNLLDIPLPILAYEDFLTSLPPTPKDMNLGLVSFLNRVDVVDQGGQFRAVISQALQPPSSQSVSTILLDIDVFRDAEFDLDYKSAWATLDQFRHVKNEAFFHLITEKMVELLE